MGLALAGAVACVMAAGGVGVGSARGGRRLVGDAATSDVVLAADGKVENTEPVQAYDIDGFENSAAEVASLKAQGKHAICYIDVGTAEDFRPDYHEFPESVLGALEWMAGGALAGHPPAERARADHDGAL